MTPLPGLCAKCYAVVHLIVREGPRELGAFGWLDPETGEPHRCAL